MGVRVAGKEETEGKWEVASLCCCYYYHSFASVAAFLQSDSRMDLCAFGGSCVCWRVQNCRDCCFSPLCLPATAMLCKWL